MTRALDLHGSRGLTGVAALVVAHAVREMREKGKGPTPEARHLMYDKARLRIEATVWLASKAATTWFDACGVDQSYALSRMKWHTHARELLNDAELGEDQTKVLELGLDAVCPTK